jgi:phenylpropionate dioxygenase-like ring-hydroxylating dioxygenase large terminal subunit
MSDLATESQLAESSAQLPVNWYLDQGILELEQKRLFSGGPGYIGHELMVPNVGDYHTLQWMDHAKALVRNQRGVELLSNVCRHRQAIMLEGRGNANNIVCPIHRWTYDLKGELLGAPAFLSKPCLHLDSTPLSSWNGMLFAGSRDVHADLAGLTALSDIDFTGYMLDRVDVRECAYNWKSFIEVYLEDYHVAPFHPGLGNFVSCDDLKWEFGEWFSSQKVGINNQLAKAGTPVYKKWHEQVLKYCNGAPPAMGAMWMVYYPNIMVEWYPHVLVVSTLLPRGPQSTTNVVEFYYPEDIVLFEREYVEAEQSAYLETAAEDDEIALRMDRGRRALLAQGINQVGPYQSPMEDGMLHFHEYLRRELGPHIPD